MGWFDSKACACILIIIRTVVRAPTRINGGDRHGRGRGRRSNNYPIEEESSGMEEGRSPSAATWASNSTLQQNPVISKNLPWIHPHHHHHDPSSSSSGCKNHTNN
jgi:hypothetical protein